MEINEELSCTGMKLMINTEYAPDYLKEVSDRYAETWQLDETQFASGRGHHKTVQQRHYELLKEYSQKLEEYVEKIQIGVADEYIAIVDVNQYRSDMDCFVPLMNKFRDTYGFYPKYPVADAGYGSYNNYIFCE